MIRLPDDMFPYRVPVTTTKSQKNPLPTTHTECKVNIDQPDPNHEKACTIPDKEIKEHGEKEKDTSEDTKQREHDQDDKYCDVTHHFSQNKPPRTLEDSVAELFHQGIYQSHLAVVIKVLHSFEQLISCPY